MLNYTNAQVTAYAEEYVTRRVVRGSRLVLPYAYDTDGKTSLCTLCGTREPDHVLIFESWKLNLGNDPHAFLAPLEPNAPLRPGEFHYKSTSVHFCKGCGSWVAEQEVIGEDLRYAVQGMGSLECFQEPRNLPGSELVQYVTLQRARISDLSPHTFERLVQEFLQSEWHPCEVLHVGSSGGRGDSGVDLLLIRDGEEYLVQVKHHPKYLRERKRRREGVRFIRELNGVLFRDGRAKGVFVTSASDYSKPAQAEVKAASQNHPTYELVLLSKLNIDRWLAKNAGPHLPWRTCMEPGGIVSHPMAYLCDPAIGNARFEEPDF